MGSKLQNAENPSKLSTVGSETVDMAIVPIVWLQSSGVRGSAQPGINIIQFELKTIFHIKKYVIIL